MVNQTAHTAPAPTGDAFHILGDEFLALQRAQIRASIDRALAIRTYDEAYATSLCDMLRSQHELSGDEQGGIDFSVSRSPAAHQSHYGYRRRSTALRLWTYTCFVCLSNKFVEQVMSR